MAEIKWVPVSTPPTTTGQWELQESWRCHTVLARSETGKLTVYHDAWYNPEDGWRIDWGFGLEPVEVVAWLWLPELPDYTGLFE